MRLVIDAMGAPQASGGMRVHAEQFVAAWIDAFPRDELVLVGNPWIAERFDDVRNVSLVVVRERGVASRFFTQVFATASMRRRTRADAVLSLSSVVTPFAPAPLTACFVHDWRHVGHPEEFGLAQRTYRRLWRYCIQRAGVTFAVSQKTLDETVRIARPRKIVLAANGADHPRRWQESPHTGSAPRILTFGHLSNKRPELAVTALPLLRTRVPDARLTIVGARGPHADSLARMAQDLGVGDAVDLPGFVPDARLQELIQSSDAVALLSSDEGYGFPVAEASYFGVPSVVTRDSGLAGIHADRDVVTADPNAESVAEALSLALDVGRREPRRRSDETWESTVTRVRDAIILHDDGPSSAAGA